MKKGPNRGLPLISHERPAKLHFCMAFLICKMTRTVTPIALHGCCKGHLHFASPNKQVGPHPLSSPIAASSHVSLLDRFTLWLSLVFLLPDVPSTSTCDLAPPTAISCPPAATVTSICFRPFRFVPSPLPKPGNYARATLNFIEPRKITSYRRQLSSLWWEVPSPTQLPLTQGPYSGQLCMAFAQAHDQPVATLPLMFACPSASLLHFCIYTDPSKAPNCMAFSFGFSSYVRLWQPPFLPYEPFTCKVLCPSQLAFFFACRPSALQVVTSAWSLSCAPDFPPFFPGTSLVPSSHTTAPCTSCSYDTNLLHC